jgi:7,8-dihydropterin-6-yl-methyl-4-(beta-D-ribofuranosyl)aminobenzene 5'-phosphate synthase
VLCETPTVVAGHAFTTGKIQRTGIERVLPNTMVEFAMKDGLGCNASHYLPAEMDGKIVPDEHIHEHATCFNVKDKGLVVISSCGHVGIVNSVRQAQEVSGIQKVHAIIGGFHLGPAPADYLTQVVAEIKKLEPDVVVPMHCSGLNFVQEARRQMPRQGAGDDDGKPAHLRGMSSQRLMAKFRIDRDAGEPAQSRNCL